MISVISPYSIDKNLGKAYNEQIRQCNYDDWIIIKDYDVLFLLPETIRHIHEYTRLYPDTGLFTCYTNRIANRNQLLDGRVSDNDSIRYHIALAKQQQGELYKITELNTPVSGMLMVIKKTCDQIKFSEDGLCLGVDEDYCKRLLERGKSIVRMEGIYVFHTYRLDKGIKNKDHLKL